MSRKGGKYSITASHVDAAFREVHCYGRNHAAQENIANARRTFCKDVNRNGADIRIKGLDGRLVIKGEGLQGSRGLECWKTALKWLAPRIHRLRMEKTDAVHGLERGAQELDPPNKSEDVGSRSGDVGSRSEDVGERSQLPSDAFSIEQRIEVAIDESIQAIIDQRSGRLKVQSQVSSEEEDEELTGEKSSEEEESFSDRVEGSIKKSIDYARAILAGSFCDQLHNSAGAFLEVSSCGIPDGLIASALSRHKVMQVKGSFSARTYEKEYELKFNEQGDLLRCISRHSFVGPLTCEVSYAERSTQAAALMFVVETDERGECIVTPPRAQSESFVTHVVDVDERQKLIIRPINQKVVSSYMAHAHSGLSNPSPFYRHMRSVLPRPFLYGGSKKEQKRINDSHKKLSELLFEYKKQIQDLVAAKEPLNLAEIKRLCKLRVKNFPRGGPFTRSCQAALWLIDYIGLDGEAGFESKELIFQQALKSLFPAGPVASDAAIITGQESFLQHLSNQAGHLAQWRDEPQRKVAFILLCLTIILIPLAIMRYGKKSVPKGQRLAQRCVGLLGKGAPSSPASESDQQP
jgi:hypothetical protein